jgi:fumarate reductase subunit C
MDKNRGVIHERSQRAVSRTLGGRDARQAGLVALWVLWALGEGPDRWAALLESLSNPLYIGFHVITLISVIFVGIRFFSLFPKAQPARIGPAKPPPGPVILVGLYAAWIGITILYSAILAGGLF